MRCFHVYCLPRCLLRREIYRRRPFNLFSSWSHARRTPRSNNTTIKPLEMQSELPIREEEDGDQNSLSHVASANLETTPLFPNSGGIRRRSASDSSVSSMMSRRRSFGREVQHAAEETFLLTRLTVTLLRYLGIGYRWIMKYLGLCLYAFLLMPGFIQVGYYYFFSSQVRRSVVYGEQPRNRLDLYLPANAKDGTPVVAFITGGAWIIGYKAWGALLGRRLAERGIIVACIDYRIYLIGQSAGAHIASCTLLNQAIKECAEGGTSWSVSQIKAYFGISGGYNIVNLVDHFHNRGLYCSIFLSVMEGEESLPEFSPELLVRKPSNRLAVSVLPQIVIFHGTSDCSIPSTARYNIVNLVDHFHNRGLYRSIFLSVMEGEESLPEFSPELLVRKPSNRLAVSVLPQIVIFHGTSDCSIPSTASKDFADALTANGAFVDLILYEGKTHTDLFLQDPLRGGSDPLLETVVSVIHEDDVNASVEDVEAPIARRLVPEWMLMLASRVSPF